jgi:hypothetical protein
MCKLKTKATSPSDSTYSVLFHGQTKLLTSVIIHRHFSESTQYISHLLTNLSAINLVLSIHNFPSKPFLHRMQVYAPWPIYITFSLGVASNNKKFIAFSRFCNGVAEYNLLLE